MIVNGSFLLEAAPIVGMVACKLTGSGGTSFGLSEAGYDIRIKQKVMFKPGEFVSVKWQEPDGSKHGHFTEGHSRFALASAMEEFAMPDNLTGIVHDKSTWARRGLSVFNTVIENGWKGYLTLELVYHGEGDLVIPAGAGIAQVIFHETKAKAAYSGKYQNQEDKPVPARDSL